MNMKRLSFILIMILGVSTAFAQKGKVTGAQNYLNAGKIDKAKEAIDLGIKHPKCVNYPKAYLVKGKVYQGIFESPLPAFKKLDENALNVAYDAYMKALELDKKGKMKKHVKAQMTNMIPDYVNDAVEKYNAKNYKGALASFERALEIENMDLFEGKLPVDTMVIYNTAMTAQQVKDYKKAEKYYREALKYNYGGGKTYANLSKALKEQGNEEEAVKYLHKGFELYPDDSYMLIELINYYMFGGEPEKAAAYLDKAIKLDPKNSSLYRAKGSLYEKTKELDKAEAMYRKALEITPDDFTSQFNLGLLKLNAVVAHHKEVNEIMDAAEYNKKIKVVFKEYADVAPYFEKVIEIKPDEKNSLIALKEIYFKLRNENPEYMEKYKAVKAKLDGMK